MIAYNILTSKRQQENFYVYQAEVSNNRIWNFQLFGSFGRKAQFFYSLGTFISFGIMIIFLVIQSLLSKTLLTVSEWYLNINLNRKEIAVSQLSTYHFLPDFSMKTGLPQTCRRFYLHTSLKSLDFLFLKSCTIKSSYRNKHVSFWAHFDFLLSSKVDFWVKQVIQTNLSFPILSWSVKLVHNSSAGKLVFSLKTSVVTINGSGIVDSGVVRF